MMQKDEGVMQLRRSLLTMSRNACLLTLAEEAIKATKKMVVDIRELSFVMILRLSRVANVCKKKMTKSVDGSF